MRWHWLMLSLLLTPAASLSALPAHAQSQDAPSVTVVFDNSGSMWGKLEGDKSNKLGAAREALLAGLQKLRPAIQTGLVTFGRRRGDCGDIEVVARPEAGDIERIKAPLDKLNPKGRGPIVQATREAAKAAAASRPASVILIHDDADNCQQDACAAAADIKRDQPGVRVHLVSIGMKREDLTRMACLAEMTGGRQFDVQNSIQLVAAVNDALALSAGAPPPPPPTPAVRPGGPISGKAPSAAARQGRRPGEAPAQGAPGLWLSAVLAKDGDLVDGPISWRVIKAAGDAQASVFEASGPETKASLPPGSYVIEARYGLASVKQPVEVAADRPTPVVVALNAGAMRMMARAQAGGPQIDQVTYALYEDAAAASGTAPLWIGRDPPTALGLPPGSYRVQAERGLARAQRSFVVAPGATAVADLALSAGLLTLRAAAREDGEPLSDVLFIISEDDPEAPQGRREIARSAAPAPDFVLPSGTYTVTLRIGSSEMRERIGVGAGESIRRTMVMGLGKLAVNARLEQAGGAPPWREAVALRVLKRGQDAREVARASSGAYTVELPAGAYRIEAQVGAQNARIVRDFELQAGRTTQLAFELQAARVTLRLADSFGTGEPAWEVRDDTGRTVWRGNQLEPRLVLAPGRYTIRAALKERRSERPLVVRSGEVRSFEVGPE